MSRPKFHTVIAITDSDWIEHIQYDPDLEILDVLTRNHAIQGYGVKVPHYRYEAVSAALFARVITAKSSGKAFNQLIRGSQGSPRGSNPRPEDLQKAVKTLDRSASVP